MTSEDLNSYKDLQEHFSNFSLIVHQFNRTKTENCILSKSLQRLTIDTETLRNSEKTLTEQLQALTKTYQKEDNVSVLYFRLKDKYSDLEKKCDYVTQQNTLLQEKNLVDVTDLEEQFKLDKNKLVQEFTQKLKDLQQQLLEERKVYLKRENELYNELQLIQASNALQCDEMQNVQNSLRFQLKEAVDSHHSLRQEYLSFKTRNQSELDAAKKMINDLKCKLQLREQQSCVNQGHTEIETPRAAHQIKSVVCNLKYDALNASALSTSKAQKLQDPSCNESSSMPKAKSSLNITSHKNKAKYVSYLPPLKKLSTVTQKSKKIKLYTPGTVNFKDIEES
ncbi:hypothetical protein RN001_011626 [Aquatica leii]|uniref:Uncharacterized protein n=1 Tax=Aquatica leii TaxID=1421715 RepID=A0AAN7SEN8_9COLE|nr:hypothetical protein RN001_011626 [Aquatica leii]